MATASTRMDAARYLHDETCSWVLEALHPHMAALGRVDRACGPGGSRHIEHLAGWLYAVADGEVADTLWPDTVDT